MWDSSGEGFFAIVSQALIYNQLQDIAQIANGCAPHMSSCNYFDLYYPWFQVVATFDLNAITDSPLMTNGGMQLYLAADGVSTLTPDVAPHRVGEMGVKLGGTPHKLRVPSLSALDSKGWVVSVYARLDCYV